LVKLGFTSPGLMRGLSVVGSDMVYHLMRKFRQATRRMTLQLYSQGNR
jgi:hypothetical protein